MLGLVSEVPVPLQLCLPMLPDETMRRGEFVNALIRRQRIGDVLQAQIQIDGFKIDLGPVRQGSQQSTELRGKIECPVLNRVIDRFLAHAVARQEQLSVPAIPQGKGSLPPQMT